MTMNNARLDIVILGLSITSSWGNGHATTYRALARALQARGHRVLFLERDVAWYAAARDLPQPPYCRTALYGSLEELRDSHAEAIRHADLVMQGSFVPDGRAVADWVLDTARGTTAFYDIDTPVTLASLLEDRCLYIARSQLPRFDLVLSFTGGPTLARLEHSFGARRVRPLYCSFDPDDYFPEPHPTAWDLGYMGTYSVDRQPALDALLTETAAVRPRWRFAVAGAMYPAELRWPRNVERIEHLPPAQHRAFYRRQRFTLNLTRADMMTWGYSPSVRLFEAAACGTPILSDDWPGLSTFFVPEREIVVVRSRADVERALTRIPAETALALGQAGRQRVLTDHTAAHRAAALEQYLGEVRAQTRRRHVA
jgi:spore maturation protein CgeB